ncbi:MAG TPA: 2-dehydropantoate 2-reductase [Gemmatimonadales bacterium]|nr:2-dehydropantoate 2-reductase [Gemmatimonadales bacterium]
MARIAVIGSGAVGCYYGALLVRAGHDVRFLMRRDLERARATGLDVRSYLGDFRVDPCQAYGSSEDIGEVDWVLCSLKATALDDAQRLIAPCIGRETRVVALMNGLGIEDRLAASFEPWRVFGGMAFVGINRDEAGVIHHLAAGRVSIGHFEDRPEENEHLRELLASGDIEVVVAPNLLYARWEKLCWNVPFNGLSVAAGGLGTQAIMSNRLLREMAERAMREVVAAANADLIAHRSEAQLDAEAVVEQLFVATEGLLDYKTSMLIDYQVGRELEVEAILGEPCRRAERLAVAAPTMKDLYTLVHAADLRRRGLIATADVE